MLTDAILDQARTRGDALADRTVAAVFDAGDTAAVAALMATLMRNDAAASAALPPAVRDYLAASAATVARAPDSVQRGERVFAEFGPEILMLLCCYSLPSSYAARKGVQVLHRTAYLAKRPNRRLFETAQMIVDVMSPGGLGPGGRGLRSAQKVRLMHAAVRHLILADRQQPWPAEFGTPINQEDLLGTLMTFSWVTLDGLRKLGLRVSPDDQQAYHEAWLAVGRLMGVEPELLPATVAEAGAVTALIERRQVAESPEGREMMAALLGMMQNNVPAAFHKIPACMIYQFLPPNVAAFLGVPHHPIDQALVGLAEVLARPLEIVATMSRHEALARHFSMHLLKAMIAFDLDGRAAFTLPSTLEQGWSLAPADSEESFWQRIKNRRQA
jgi:uncharacterized protein (DUF2236 family)